MPVTAKLSLKFYERLGEDVANELVEWFNAVDATYRNDLRELNEHNFARFDAKLEQRLAQYDAKWEQRLAQYDVKWERRLADFRVELHREIGAAKSDLIKWGVGLSVGLWVPVALALIGLYIKS